MTFLPLNQQRQSTEGNHWRLIFARYITRIFLLTYFTIIVFCPHFLLSGQLIAYCVWLSWMVVYNNHCFHYLAPQVSSVPIQMLPRPPLSSNNNHYWVNIVAVLYTNTGYGNALTSTCFHNHTLQGLRFYTACPATNLLYLVLYGSINAGKWMGFIFKTKLFCVVLFCGWFAYFCGLKNGSDIVPVRPHAGCRLQHTL